MRDRKCQFEMHFVPWNEKEGRVVEISREWIEGLPRCPSMSEQEIAQRLKDTYVRLAPLCGGGYKAYVHSRLRGGFFSTISAAINFLTANSYRKLVKEAGGEARTTIQLAGQETRATVAHAEASANRTIENMGGQVRNSIYAAQRSTDEVITRTRQEAEGVLAFTGEETRHSAKIIELQIEKALRVAAREVHGFLTAAGQETAERIFQCGEEARETSCAITHDFRTLIADSGLETRGYLTQCGDEVRNILERAREEAVVVIREGGAEFQQKSQAVIMTALDEVQSTVTGVLRTTENSMAQLIAQASKEAQGVIISFGEQGRLLVRDTGHEIRVVADEILTHAFQGQEMILHLAGQEARFTIRELGTEIRSIMYELPTIAASIAETVGRNLAAGVRQGLFGQTELNRLSNRIQDLRGVSVDPQALIEFVQDQPLEPEEKLDLYKVLVRFFNDPAIEQELRKQCLLCVGVAALADGGLQQANGVLFAGAHLGQDLISLMPQTISRILQEHGIHALDAEYQPQEEYYEIVPFVHPEPTAEELLRDSLLILEEEKCALALRTEFYEIEKNEAIQREEALRRQLEERSSAATASASELRAEVESLREELNRAKAVISEMREEVLQEAVTAHRKGAQWN